MIIHSITDDAFKPYGRIVTGCDTAGILSALAGTPISDGVAYVPRDEALHNACGADTLRDILFGGMPCQLGWCNGHNTRLNCLEYHRDSEFNLGTEDFILLLARQQDITDGRLDTSLVQAFRVPAGTLIEVYATTLHYAPCSARKGAGFRVLVALPEGTNTPYRFQNAPNAADATLWARNKWLLAHPDSAEAAQGAHAGLRGENIDINHML